MKKGTYMLVNQWNYVFFKLTDSTVVIFQLRDKDLQQFFIKRQVSVLHRQFGHNVRLTVGGCWMNMSTLGTDTHHQITKARSQYFKDWLHSRAPTLQALIECNLRSTSLEPAPSPPGNYTKTRYTSILFCLCCDYFHVFYSTKYGTSVAIFVNTVCLDFIARNVKRASC